MKSLPGLCIGVVGSIGSGKSFLCSRLRVVGEDRGIRLKLLDFDMLRRSILDEPQCQSHSELKDGLIRSFGSEVLDKTGQIHRLRLNEIIFENREALDHFNSLLFPILVKELRIRIKDGDVTLIEWPNLKSQGIGELVGGNVIYVTCGLRERFIRLRDSNLRHSQIRKRMRLQAQQGEIPSILDEWEERGGMVWSFRSDKDDLERFCESVLARVNRKLNLRRASDDGNRV